MLDIIAMHLKGVSTFISHSWSPKMLTQRYRLEAGEREVQVNAQNGEK